MFTILATNNYFTNYNLTTTYTTSKEPFNYIVDKDLTLFYL